jgi:hypothetical protein
LCCGGLEGVPFAGGEVAFEALDGFPVGLAFGGLVGDVDLGLGVAAAACDGDAVDGRVELAVAAAVEVVAVGLAGANGDRCKSGGAGELGVAFEVSRARARIATRVGAKPPPGKLTSAPRTSTPLRRAPRTAARRTSRRAQPTGST